MNEQIFSALNGLIGSSTFFDGLVVFLAVYLGPLFLVYILYRESFRDHASKRQKRNDLAFLFMILIGAVIAFLLSEIINNLYLSARPDAILTGVRNVVGKTGFDSFPSGHTTFFFALAFFFFFDRREYFWVGLTVAALVSLARVIGGAHFPGDVIGGVALALLTVLFLRPLFKKIRTLYE